MPTFYLSLAKWLNIRLRLSDCGFKSRCYHLPNHVISYFSFNLKHKLPSFFGNVPRNLIVNTYKKLKLFAGKQYRVFDLEYHINFHSNPQKRIRDITQEVSSQQQ